MLYFNPRPREEGDLNELFKGDENYHISIHALVKRATYGGDKVLAGLGDFNPRPREEGDVPATRPAERGGNFNPRPREEGDKRHMVFIVLRRYFNPRPREEGDAIQTVSDDMTFIFQSTPS